MTVKPILEEQFWVDRAKNAKHEHQAVFQCTPDKWQRICAAHHDMLLQVIEPHHDVLDVGCGWGRLIDIMPKQWHGGYLGIDYCDHFIEKAKKNYPGHKFIRTDVLILKGLTQHIFDWAILISFRQMITSNLGQAAWTARHGAIWTRARKLLYLEYDEKEPGRIEEYKGQFPEKKIWPVG